MKNIFKDAKFGDIFITPEEEKMKFIMSDNHKAVLLEENNITGRQWIWECNLDGTTDYGEIAISHKATPTPMNEEYLLSKGFLKGSDDDSDDDFDYSFDSETFISSNRQIMVQRYQVAKAFPYGWFMLVKNRDMEDIGSLDFIYVEQFESFLKLCGIE